MNKPKLERLQQVDLREMPENKSSRISYSVDGDPSDKSMWPDQNKKLKSMVESFHRVFYDRIRALTIQ